MATAKRDLTDTRVQGHRLAKDPLDRLVAIAIRIALREGLLDESDDELSTRDRAEHESEGRRRA